MAKHITPKFILCYLVTVVCMFILLNTYGIGKLEQKLLEEKKTTLYNEASLIATEYGENYYSSAIKTAELRKQLVTIDTFLGMRIMLVNANGRIVLDTDNAAASAVNLLSYDPDFFNETYNANVFIAGVYNEEALVASEPIFYDYVLRGYVCVSIPMSSIDAETMYYINFVNICYMIFLVIMFLTFVYLYFTLVIPAELLKRTATEYARGNYDYKSKWKYYDEFKETSDAMTCVVNELQSLEDYQKKFIANISHDFRSPLTSIKGYIEAIKDGTIPYESQNRYMDIILFETDRLTKLTSNLLLLNSVDNNKAFLDISTFDINSVIKDTAASFEGTCTKKKISIELIFSAAENYVSADMSKIQQVLYNLIDNAIKFSNTDSVINISAEAKGNKVLIGVKDHGIGIPKDSLKKVWERFYKTDISRGKDKKGMGLGLSIVKDIITAHSENINVISTEGVGTEFIFSLQHVDI